MPLADLLFNVIISLIIGFIPGFYYVKAQISAIEDKATRNWRGGIWKLLVISKKNPQSNPGVWKFVILERSLHAKQVME
jgi:hypothetical protein